ncbi:MAG: tryptophan synthase subunit alpha [Lachnospiraceae bacterium]|jgi:tryptophan synthase alpha chain|nr:tryptophan synthase subunit alpha [Lachnospiraceae bacterium]
MSRISDAFAKGKVFIPFVTGGDPNVETTYRIIMAMVENGADIIEIGIPFSDPIAEGPVIQEADIRALASGTTTDSLFDLVVRLRKETDVPLIFMTYMNPIYVYGTDNFMKKCAEVGIDGVIVPDVPFEEKEELRQQCEDNGLDLISMIAPTSEARIESIAKEAKGFIYCVSSLGVTGVRSEITTDIGEMVRHVKNVTDTPVAVGFGISTPEQAKKMAGLSDGAIVGSAIVKIIAKHGKDAVPYVAEYVKSMKEAVLQA